MFEARRLKVSGWVRNCSDGSVELECEGEVARVALLLVWCERGPAGARVTRVSIDELPLRNNDADGFVLRTDG